MQKIDFQLTVSPSYIGEFYDALGMQSALRRKGYTCIINPIDPVANICRRSELDQDVSVNVSFHSSYLPNSHADKNLLFYHEVHDKFGLQDDGCFELLNRDNIPFDLFGVYDGVFTPSNRFGLLYGLDPLVMAVDSDLFHRTKKMKQYACDVVFIGGAHKDREIDYAVELLNGIAKRGHIVHVYGGGWEQYINGEPVNGEKIVWEPNVVFKGAIPVADSKYVYSSAKVGLNFACEGMRAGGLGTNRLYQMALCGLPSVSYGCSDYYNAYGIDDKMVLWSNNIDEYIENVETLMHHPDKRKAMSKRIISYTKKYHTWDIRIDDFLKIVEKPEQEYRRHVRKNYPHAQIHIGIPSTDPRIEFATSLPKFVSMGREPVPIDLQAHRSSFDIGSTRNDICQYTLDNNIPWTLMIDDDNPMEPHNLDYLLSDICEGYEVIFGWYRNSNTPDGRLEPHIHIDDGDGNLVRITDPPDKIIRVSSASTGFLAISSNVLRRFQEHSIPWFNYISRWSPYYFTHGIMGEDRWFCNMCSELDIPVYVDGRIFCGHDKTWKDQKDRTHSRVV